MRVLVLAMMALIVPVSTARAERFDLDDIYRRIDGFVKSLTEPAPRERDLAKVPFAEIDPKMTVVPREPGTMRVIPPPGSPGGDPKTLPK